MPIIRLRTGRSRSDLVRPADAVETAFGALLALAVLISAGVVGMLIEAARLDISPWAADDLPYYLCGAVTLALHVALRDAPSPAARRIADGALWFGLFTIIALLGAIASYPLASDSRGFCDATLEHIDHSLHFDWIAWYDVVAAHPLLQHAGCAAYQSIFVTPALLLGVFAWTGRRLHAQRFLASFWLAGTLTLALFRFMPAVGPLASLWRGPIPYMPQSALWQTRIIPDLRGHLLHTIDLGALRGLVSAPSFHTEAAILYAAAAWPHRALRAPVAAISLAMLLATPVEGTHYLADMLAGALVASAALLGVAAIERSLRQRNDDSSQARLIAA